MIVFNVAEPGDRTFGYRPVDAVESTLDVDGSTLKQSGIMGSAIINGNTTQLVDVYEIVKLLNPSWFEKQALPESKRARGMTILLPKIQDFSVIRLKPLWRIMDTRF